MAGDVRGTFDLNDRPATSAMRRLRQEGEGLDLVLTKLGETVDSVFSEKNVAEVKGYELALGSLDRQARQSFNSIGRNAREAEFQTVGSIRRMDASVALFRENLDSLSRENATPKINLKGFDEALAQTELLHKRINALGREVAHPRVAIPQSALAAGAVTRAASSGGGGGFGGGGLKIPFLGTAPWPLVGGAIAAAPPLIGATTALGGSLGGAALGAGTLGLGAAGVGAATLGLAAPTAIASIAGIKEASKALTNYRKEVIKSGVNSEAARQKYRLLNMELKKAPAGTERLLKAKEGLVEDFRSSTKPAQAGFTGILTRGLNLGRQLNPLYSDQANQFFGQAQPQFGQYADFLNSGSSRQFYESIGNEATKSLRPTENIAENITSTLMNLTRASRPFFREGLHFLDDWTGGWRKSSRDISGVRDDMRGWVGDLKTWGKLTGATFELLKDLGSAGSGSGSSLVGDLTKQLEVWDDWVKNNPRQVRTFFHESVESTEKLAEAVGRIFNLVWKIGRQLGPLLDQFSELVTLAGDVGLLSPGGLPLLLAGGAGIRNATRGLGTRLRGGAEAGAAGGAPLIIGGGAAAGVGTAATSRFFDRGTYDLARSFGRGRFTSTVAGVGVSGLGERTAAFGRGFAGRFGPYAALAFGLGAASDRGGNLWERIATGANQATLGIFPAPADKGEQYEKGLRQAQFISHRITSTPGLSLQQKSGRLYNALARTYEIGTEGAGSEELPAETTKARVKALAAARGQFREYATQKRVERGEGVLGDISNAYQVRKAKGTDGAGHTAIEAIEREAKTMHGKTLRVFDQLGLEWARELAKSNPKLRGAVNEMADNIEARFARMGQQVKIINGNIVDTSAQSWGKVADLIGTETQLAYSEANKNLTALEKRAEAILLHMGYNHTQAQSIMHEAQTGRPTKAGSEANAEAHHHGMPGATINNMKSGGNASGGRLPMPANGSMHDQLHLGNNQWAAGDELVVNRHTESRVNRILRMAGTTLGREVAGENRAHHQMPTMEANAALGARMVHRAATGRRFATGGITAAGKLASSMGLSVGEGPGYGGVPSSGHVGDSLHYQGLAYDVSGSPALMRRYFYTALRDFRGSINELFYDPIGWYIDQGHKVPGAIGGHSDHVHIGFFPSGAQWTRGAARGRGSMAGRGGGGAQQVHLKGPGSKRGGLTGAAVTAAGDLEAAGLSKSLNKVLARRGGPGGFGGGLAAPGGSRSAVERQIARELFRHGANKVGAAGIIGNAYRESGMDPGAEGTGGGGLWGFTAGAISLANLKAAGGKNWESPVFQTRFMLQHGGQGLVPALNKAGSPEAAARIFMEQWERPGIPALADREQGARVAFGQGFKRGGRVSHGFAGWFKDGFRGRVSGPTLMGVGEAGPEDVQITPTSKRGRAGRRGAHGPIEVNVNMGGVSVHGAADTEKVGKEIGRHAARELTKALQESDDVPDGELIGA